MLFADGVAGVAARQQMALEKAGKIIDRALGLFDGGSERVRVYGRGLHFRMLGQAVEKADAALGAFDGVLGPELGWIGVFTV